MGNRFEGTPIVIQFSREDREHDPLLCPAPLPQGRLCCIFNFITLSNKLVIFEGIDLHPTAVIVLL